MQMEICLPRNFWKMSITNKIFLDKKFLYVQRLCIMSFHNAAKFKYFSIHDWFIHYSTGNYDFFTHISDIVYHFCSIFFKININSRWYCWDCQTNMLCRRVCHIWLNEVVLQETKIYVSKIVHLFHNKHVTWSKCIASVPRDAWVCSPRFCAVFPFSTSFSSQPLTSSLKPGFHLCSSLSSTSKMPLMFETM